MARRIRSRGSAGTLLTGCPYKWSSPQQPVGLDLRTHDGRRRPRPGTGAGPRRRRCRQAGGAGQYVGWPWVPATLTKRKHRPSAEWSASASWGRVMGVAPPAWPRQWRHRPRGRRPGPQPGPRRCRMHNKASSVPPGGAQPPGHRPCRRRPTTAGLDDPGGGGYGPQDRRPSASAVDPGSRRKHSVGCPRYPTSTSTRSVSGVSR